MEKREKIINIIFKVIIQVIFAIIIFDLAWRILYSSPYFEGVMGVDSAVFKIMAKGILKGRVLYTDLFDHKGPLLYVINLIGLLINKDIGIFILEIVFMYIGQYFVLKSSRLLIKSEILQYIPSLFYILVILYNAEGGNLTEEYAMLFSAIALFYMIKIIFKNEIICHKNWLIIGITFAINILIKPTYIAPWIAFGITILIKLIKDKKIAELFKGILAALIGGLIILIPILLYMIITNSFTDFIKSYVILNTKYSSATLKRRLIVAYYLCKNKGYMGILIFTLICNIFVLVTKKISYIEKLFISMFICITLILTHTGANMYEHYLMQNTVAVVLEFIVFISIIENLINKKIIFCTIAILFFIIFFRKYVLYDIKSDKNFMFESKKNIAEIMKKYPSEDYKVFVLGNNSEWYIYINQMPNTKYFFQYPVVLYDDEIFELTYEYIKNEKPDIVLLGWGNQKMLELNNYKILGELNQDYVKQYEGSICYYVKK